MADSFDTNEISLNSPAANSLAITPHDTNELAYVSRGLFVGTGGNIALKLDNDSSSVILYNVQNGCVLPLRAKLILSTGTTASNIVALY
jgi:hypothetical protein